MTRSICLSGALAALLFAVVADCAAGKPARPATFVRQLAPTLRPAGAGHQTIVIAARTRPGASCRMTVAVKRVRQTFARVRATRSGRVTWRWQILPSSPSGNWRITVACRKAGRGGIAVRRVLVVTRSRAGRGPIGNPNSLAIPDGEPAGRGGASCGPFTDRDLPGGGKQCTCLAWEKRRDVYDTSVARGVSASGWNGSQWLVNARRGGFPTGSQPVRGALVVWGVPNSSDYGHVAYVENVSSATSIQISECNYDWNGSCRTRWLNPQAKANLQGYVYGGPAGGGPGGAPGDSGGLPTSAGGGLQMLVDGVGQVWAKNTIGDGGWTRETPPGHTAIAAGDGGLQMLLDGVGQVWAKNTIGDGGWTRETPPGHTRIAAGDGGLQMLLDGVGQVWAKNTIGDGGWTRETPPGHTRIAAGDGGLQMLLDSAGQVWAKNTIGDGGWTRETGPGHTAIAAGDGGLQMLLDSAGQVWAKNTIGDGGWARETPPGHAMIAAG